MIGIFDSGVGGLTVLKALREALPSADVVYFGDTKNAPYGSRPRSELTALTVRGLKFLQDRGATNIVSACNSVSASLAVSLYDALSISPKQLIEMVGPTVAYCKGSNARIVLTATPATIESELYQNAFSMIGRDIETVVLPELAGAIERGADDASIRALIKAAFSNTSFSKGDVLILACTHYPLVIEQFRDVLGPDVSLLDPAYAVAERAQEQFWPQEVGNGATDFFISAESETFRSIVGRFFKDQPCTLKVLE